MTEEVRIPETKKRRFRLMEKTWFRLVIAGVFVGLLAGAVGASGYFYRAYQKTLSEKDTLLSQMSGDAGVPEVESVVLAVAKLIELPQGETPTLATVSDKTKLEGQSFFNRAENGDKVLIYTAAGKAILYRPSVGKVIDMTTVNLTPDAPKTEEVTEAPPESETVVGASTEVSGEESAGDSASESEEIVDRAFTVAVANGTETAGRAKKTAEMVAGSFASASISQVTDAKKKDYAETIIVDVSGTYAKEALSVAELLHGVVGLVPDGEIVPDGVDIFVVVGGSVE